jgi:polyhydroxybutyrate depolymerase
MKNQVRTLLLSVASLISASGLLAGQPIRELARERAASLPLPEGSEQRVITVGGIERNFWLVRPASARTPAPVVFVLHGGASADGRQTLRFGFQALGARDGVVTIHPSGVGAGWNDGRETSYLLSRGGGGGVDDVAFFRAIIDSLIREKIADPARIYITGGSNGGMMTMRLVCELSDTIAGAAPFIALLPEKLRDRCNPPRPVSMMLIVSTADRLMPYDGGNVVMMAREDHGRVLSAAETFAFWQEKNRCHRKVASGLFPDVNPDDGTRIRTERAEGCAARLEMVIVEGGGHRLPGEGTRLYGESRIGLLSGVSSRDINGRDLIWKFFFEKM